MTWVQSALTEWAGAGLHADVLDDFKDQLLIVFLKRLQERGDGLVFPVAEIDDTEQDTLSFNLDAEKRFHFVLGKKA